jgi:hypothetical protein
VVVLPVLAVTLVASDTTWQEGEQSAEDAATAKLQGSMGPFENFIVGLLTNMGAMPLERLHNMLRAFVVGEPR